MYFCARFLKTDMAQFTEEDKIMRRVEQRFNKGMVKYRLIEDGDKILVGLSGGKDSLALLELLAKRSRILKPRFTVMAVHIGMTNIPYQSDLEYLKNYAEGLGVPFVYFETSFDLSTDTRKSPCFLCSWNRRKALFTVAKEHGCTKIALGHHMDDILETLLMNITFQGSCSGVSSADKELSLRKPGKSFGHERGVEIFREIESRGTL